MAIERGKIRVEYVFDNGLTVSGLVEKGFRILRDPNDLTKPIEKTTPEDLVVCVLPPGRLIQGGVAPQ